MPSVTVRPVRWTVYIAVWLAVPVLMPIIVVAEVRWLSPVGARLAIRLQGKSIANLLPTSARIVGYSAAWTPPIRARRLTRDWVLGFLLGPIGDAILTVLFLRRHSPCGVVTTADGTVWAFRLGRGRKRQMVLIGHEPVLDWRPTRIGWALVEGTIAGEPMTLMPGPATTDLEGNR